MSTSAPAKLLESLTAHGPRAAFPSTRWTLIERLRNHEAVDKDDRALAELCRLYWPPIYAFLRRKGYRPMDAQDLTQGFFAMVIAKNMFGSADPGKGRLRTFLLSALRNFVADHHRKEGAVKRGGGERVMSMDAEDAEGLLNQIPSTGLTPDGVFEQAWALRLLDLVLEQTRARYERIHKGAEFQGLAPYLSGDDPSPPYRELAARMNLAEASVRLLMHRMRRRYRLILEESIAESAGSRADAEDELGHLFRVLGR